MILNFFLKFEFESKAIFLKIFSEPRRTTSNPAKWWFNIHYGLIVFPKKVWKRLKSTMTRQNISTKDAFLLLEVK